MSQLYRIRKQFEHVIEYSQDIPNVNCGQLFKDWFKAKRFFIEKFGGLTYEVGPVQADLTGKQKIDKVDQFCATISSRFNKPRLADFIWRNKDGFFDNTVLEGTDDIPKGMKLLKAFKFFCDDEEILKEMQNLASTYIQENKLTGTLCLSVHPLDYISSSENTYNWRSCHALDGEYRAGNISYMLDECTVVCYIKADGEHKLPRFPQDVPWNSKKWRMLLFVSKERNMMFAGRQYPFGVGKVLDIIRNVARDIELVNIRREGFWGPDEELTQWSDYWIKDFPVNDSKIGLKNWFIMGSGHRLKRRDKLIQDAEGSKHYNDLLYSSFYVPYWCYVIERGKMCPNNDSSFVIGGKTKCLCCGEHEVFGADSFTCGECYDNNYDVYFCCECGDRITDGIWIDDEIYCSHCADRYLTQCPACGYYFRPTGDETVCPACQEEERHANIVRPYDMMVDPEHDNRWVMVPTGENIRDSFQTVINNIERMELNANGERPGGEATPDRHVVFTF